MFETYDKLTSLYLKRCRRNALAENSLATYQRSFDYLRGWASANGFEEITAETVELWANHLFEAVSLSTMDIYLRNIKRLSDYGVEIGVLPSPIITEKSLPASRKVAKERQKDYAHILDKEDARTLVSAQRANFGRTPHTFLREKAIVTLLITSGLRNTELRSLTPADLDWEDSEIRARVTKGDKPRTVPFADPAKAAITAYLQSDLAPENLPDDAPLFGVAAKDGAWHGLGNQQLSALVYNYVKSILGEEAACRTHALRHCMASLSLDSGMELGDIAQLLGHASVTTTQIYAKRLHPETVVRSAAATLSSLLA